MGSILSPHDSGLFRACLWLLTLVCSQDGNDFKCLYNQLVWSLGHMVDSLFACLASNPCSGVFKLKLYSWEEAEAATSQYLAQYCQGIQSEFDKKPPDMLSCAPDKSRVHSYCMFSTVFAFPWNAAFWGHPRDLLGLNIVCPFLRPRGGPMGRGPRGPGR